MLPRVYSILGPSRHSSLLRLLPSVPALLRLLPTITTLVTTVASSTLLIVPFVPGHSAVVCQRDPEPDGSCRRDLLRVPASRGSFRYKHAPEDMAIPQEHARVPYTR
ncbi:hypothetical protein NUW54_g14290 [Trametes sanguinea]|uniref:Uncharacterized protein n=1 Tax=Trametes sanguinea TaxID=158606 RepID=A0ACC1MFF0_9APHY|nr:hypothetical protein NUW54_g14290 [Trametes sanguinea]